MTSLILPECPAPLRGIQQFLKAATEHEQRNPVVTYWCRLHALQTGLKLSTKTSEETGFLLKLMDWLESTKKSQSDNEAITNEVAAQAHLENYALQLFVYADSNDRASNFGKNIIKAFYTAGVIYDVSTTFGELSEEATQNRKYAKWKAAYIHNCLKNGETPLPGPMKDDDDDSAENNDAESGPAGNVPSTSGLADEQEQVPHIESESAEDHEPEPESESADSNPENDEAGFSHPTPPPTSDAFGFPSVPKPSSTGFPQLPTNPNPGNLPYPNLPKPDNPNPYNPPSTPTSVTPSQPSYDPSIYNVTPITDGGVTLSMDQMAKAQKYVKWAGSALNYDDIPTTVLNLQKALHLLTTGQDPA